MHVLSELFLCNLVARLIISGGQFVRGHLNTNICLQMYSTRNPQFNENTSQKYHIILTNSWIFFR